MNVLLDGFLRHTTWETDVVTRSLGPEESIELRPGVMIHRLACGAQRPWSREQAWQQLPAFSLALRRFLEQRPPYQAVSAHYWMSAVLLWQARLPGGIVFHTLQAQKGPPQGTLESRRLAWESYLIRHYPTAYLHWHDLRNAQAHYPELRGCVIRPGTDLRTISRPDPVPPIVYGWAARKDPIKNLQEAVEWVAERRRQGQDSRLRVAGMTAEGNPVEPWIEYLGPLDPLEMPEFYGSIHQLLNLSQYETFGLSLLEALACGAAVGVRQESDWARRLRRLSIPWQPGVLFHEKERAAARRLARTYTWERSLGSWERWLQGLRKAQSPLNPLRV